MAGEAVAEFVVTTIVAITLASSRAATHLVVCSAEAVKQSHEARLTPHRVQERVSLEPRVAWEPGIGRLFEPRDAIGLPDTLRLSADEKMLTVGLRTSPAQLAVVDTGTFTFDLVALSAPGETTTIGGHQWTSRGGQYTFAAFEGGAHPGVAVIDHRDGNKVVQTLDYPGRPHGVDHARP